MEPLKREFESVALLSPTKRTPTKLGMLEAQYKQLVADECGNDWSSALGEPTATYCIHKAVTRVLHPDCKCNCCVQCRLTSEMTRTRLSVMQATLSQTRTQLSETRTQLSETRTQLEQLERKLDCERAYRELVQNSYNNVKEYIFGDEWPEGQGFLKVVSALRGSPVGVKTMPSQSQQQRMNINPEHRAKFLELSTKLHETDIDLPKYAETLQGANHECYQLIHNGSRKLMYDLAKMGRDVMYEHFSCLVDDEQVDSESLWLAIDGFIWWTKGGPDAPTSAASSTSNSTTAWASPAGDTRASAAKRKHISNTEPAMSCSDSDAKRTREDTPRAPGKIVFRKPKTESIDG